MKKFIIAIVFATSAIALTGCGFTGAGSGCCRTAATCTPACTTSAYTFSGSCGTNLCNAGWY